MRGHPRRVDEEAIGLPTVRIRTRLSAYVYGNILVLTAIATTTPHMVETGLAAVVVAATTVTTYFAHVLAHFVAEHVEDENVVELESDRDELRDALPIISSGAAPTIVLAVAGLLDVHHTAMWVLIAAGVVLLRLAGLGALVAYLNGQQPAARAHLWGLGVAGVGLVIVVLKVWIAH